MGKTSKSTEHKVLYRKYRSSNFSEVVGQEHITKVLENSIKNNSVAHAYLFSGPRGVGKTTVARILAKRINDLDEQINTQDILDIIEIDAASNRRIDDIRELRSKVQIAPSNLRYKIYIIDEVHMLTKESFNALLKTLEEPPAHVVFILATTEAHKLPATIISRTQHFKFKPINNLAIADHLANIAEKESIDIDKQSLELIADRADGGMRDAVSLLDQISSVSSKIDLKTTELFLGVANQKSIANLVDNIIQGNTRNTLKIYKDLISEGVDPLRLIEQLYDLSKNKLLEEKNSLNQLTYMKLMRAALEAMDSQNSKMALEINLISCTLSDFDIPKNNSQSEHSTPKQPTQTKVLASNTPIKSLTTPPHNKILGKKSLKSNIGQINSMDSKAKIPEINLNTSNNKNTDAIQEISTDDNQLWEAIVQDIRATNSSLAGLLTQVIARFDNETITIICPYKFHVKRLETVKYQSLLVSACTTSYREGIQLNIIHDNSQFKSEGTKSANDATTQDYPTELTELQNIMGGQIINV